LFITKSGNKSTLFAETTLPIKLDERKRGNREWESLKANYKEHANRENLTEIKHRTSISTEVTA